jgi:hypothetical protein
LVEVMETYGSGDGVYEDEVVGIEGLGVDIGDVELEEIG